MVATQGISRFPQSSVGIAVVGLTIYTVLVVGGPVPHPSEVPGSVLARWIACGLALWVLILTGTSWRAIGLILIFLSVAGLLLVPRLLESEHVHYAVAKSSDLVFGAAVALLLSARLATSAGSRGVLKALLMAGVIVLAATLVFKAALGFWSRDVRFLLNGPIVFGWLMGLMSLIAWGCWKSSRRGRFLLLFVGFVLAVVWTESKGPLVALLLIVLARLLFGLFPRRRERLRAVVGLAAVLGALWFGLYEFGDALLETRYGGAIRLVEGGLHERDEGSVGMRMVMLSEALEIARERFWQGVGPGNWVDASTTGFAYPHNQHLEVLVEFGFAPFLAYVLFISIGLILASPDIRWMLLFLCLVASFSGDMAYLRYPFFLVLLSLLVRSQTNDEVVCARNGSKVARASQ